MKKIFKFASLIALTAIISVCGNYAAAEAWETWYVSAWSGLNCRTEPTTDSDILVTYPRGQELQIIGVDSTNNEWWETWDGAVQGWCNSKYLTNNLDAATSGGGTYFGRVKCTGYTPNPAENGGSSVDCFGDPLWPQVGQIVAVDPSVIPLGVNIYISGIGYRKTHDTGVYGNVIDVLVSSDAEANTLTGWYDVYLTE